MKIKKISPGVEELHRPMYIQFVPGEEVEVPEDIGQALVKRPDFVEVENKLIEFGKLEKEHKRKRR